MEFEIWLFYRAADDGTRPENFQNVFSISISVYNLEISKFWIFVLDARYVEEEEAKVMEVFPHIHHHHRHRLLSSFWQCRQLMQALVQNQQNQPIGGAPRDKHGEFLKGHPRCFLMPLIHWKQMIGFMQ